MTFPNADQNKPRVLRLPQVCELTGIKRSLIYQMESEQRFPHRIKLGARAVGWLESEIRDWIASRIAASRTSNRS